MLKMGKKRRAESRPVGQRRKKEPDSKSDEPAASSDEPLSDLDQDSQHSDSDDGGGTTIDEEWLKAFDGFRSYNEPLPANFTSPALEEKAPADKRLKLGPYFFDYIYKPPQSHLKVGCYPSAPTEPPVSLLRALERRSQYDFWSSKRGLDAAQVPDNLRKPFRKLMKEDCYVDAVSGLSDFVKDDTQTRLAQNQLGVESFLSTDIDKVVDYGTLMSLLTDYLSVDLSVHNMLSNEKVRRIVSLHVARHLQATQAQQCLTRGTGQTFGWTRPKILIIAPTKFIAKQWVTNLQALLSCKDDKVRSVCCEGHD